MILENVLKETGLILNFIDIKTMDFELQITTFHEIFLVLVQLMKKYFLP